MANEAFELAVALRGEGIDETEQDLRGVEGSFDDTSESVGESASEMEGFAQRWQGAMTAVVTGLAVAAAGLLSQVPVIGELMRGLVGILDAVAFQMDSVLRPVLLPLTEQFFELEAAIFEADGAMGTFIGVTATLASLLGILLGVAASLGAVLPGLTMTGAVGKVIGAFTTLVKATATVVGALIGLLTLPALLVGAFVLLTAAVLAFTLAYITNFRGVRDMTDAFIDDILDSFAAWLAGVTGISEDLIRKILEIAREPSQVLEQRFAELFSTILDAARSWANSFVAIVERAVNTAIEGIPSELRSEVGLDTVSIDRPFGSGGGGGGTISGGMDSIRAFAAGGGDQIAVMLDGRRVDRGTRAHRDERTSARGQFGI